MTQFIQDMLQFIQENIFSIITATIAVIALWQTHIQIKISNKQFLFKNRLEKYTIANMLIELFKENQSLLDYSNKKDNEAIIVDIQFASLTNVGYLKDITGIISDPKNNEIKTEFLLKLEEIKQLANEIKFLFKREQGLLLNIFIVDYKNVLMELYKYQIFQNSMRENRIPMLKPKTYVELQEEFDEKSHRMRLFSAINQLENSYRKIQDEDVIAKIEKEIKL